jgi:hypothetical protein
VAVLAVAVGWWGAVLLALGSCHDSGGFCAPSFSGTHVALYGIGVVLLSLATGVLAAVLTQRRRLATGVGGAAAAVLLALVVVLEAVG